MGVALRGQPSRAYSDIIRKMASTDLGVGQCVGAFHEDLNRYSSFVSKWAYACTNEGDWCENHGYNSSHVRCRPLGAEEEEGKEEEKVEEATAAKEEER